MEFKQSGFGTPRKANLEVVDAVIIDSKFTDKSGKPSKQLKLTLRDLEGKWKDQYEWYGISEHTPSAFADLVERLRDLEIISRKEIADAPDALALATLIINKIKGKKFAFEEQKAGKKSSYTWLPVNTL